jgi:hypothetical protein
MIAALAATLDAGSPTALGTGLKRFTDTAQPSARPLLICDSTNQRRMGRTKIRCVSVIADCRNPVKAAFQHLLRPEGTPATAGR